MLKRVEWVHNRRGGKDSACFQNLADAWIGGPDAG